MNQTSHLFYLRLILALSFFLRSEDSIAQEIESFEDFKDIFTFYPNKRIADQDSSIYLSKFVVAPIISYSPETSLGFGLGSKYLFKFKGSGDETRTSNMPLTIQYTLNNQFIFYSGFEVFTNQEKWVISGNFTYQNYPRKYYGIGRNTLTSDEEEYNYYQFLVEPIFLKQLFLEYLFIGGGFRYNRYYNVNVDTDKPEVESRPTSFFGSTSTGIELATLYDSRNNILNAKKGWYFEYTYGFYDEQFGGTEDFDLMRFDLRHYITPFKNREDVLAFQFIGHFSYDDVPFSELALFGSSEILRGYREGRYIDRNLLAGQAEYRYNIKNSRWGIVAFLATGDVYEDINDFQFKNLRPNIGTGARFMLDKEERLNIRLDWGFGYQTNNLYLGISEAF